MKTRLSTGGTVLAAALTLLLAAGDASAQSGRRGFWLEGMVGTGTVRNTCAGCPGVTVGYGSAYHLRVGGSLNQRVQLGLEVFSMTASDFRPGPGADPVDAENASLAPIVLWYVGRSGFFLKAGAGLARGTFTVESEEGSELITIERTGSGLTFGVGFDMRLADWLALTANLGTYVTAIGDVSVNDTLVDDIIATVYEAGVGLTLR
ncbi:MAG: outer membrane beta-barrel protein [Gemmatimonadota bacterium]|jgi:hypothetical protein